MKIKYVVASLFLSMVALLGARPAHAREYSFDLTQESAKECLTKLYAHHQKRSTISYEILGGCFLRDLAFPAVNCEGLPEGVTLWVPTNDELPNLGKSCRENQFMVVDKRYGLTVWCVDFAKIPRKQVIAEVPAPIIEPKKDPVKITVRVGRNIKLGPYFSRTEFNQSMRQIKQVYPNDPQATGNEPREVLVPGAAE